MRISNENQKLWVWLCTRGGKWTAQELAHNLGGDSQRIFRQLHGMSRRQLVAQFDPEQGSRYKRYGVTGTCLVPYGVSVAETQA